MTAAAPVLDVRLHHAVGARGRRFELSLAFRSDAARTVLLGASGAGKTLTLHAIAGLLRPQEGRVAVGGRVLFDSAAGVDLPARSRGFGVVFQDYALFPHLSVRQNVAFGLRHGWRNPPRELVDTFVDAQLERLELASVQHQRPHELSGGQRQRTALARALVTRPGALLLDEPFAALDPPLRRRLRDDLDAVLREAGVPLLMITHDLVDRDRFGEAVVTLAAGRVVPHFAPSETGDA